MPSLVLVKPFTSQNSTVMTRRWPSAASAGPSISPSTTRGSTYLPKVSRRRSLSRSCSTIRLNAVVNWPISSCEVATSVPPRSPASTARVPSSNRRTGRVTPALTSIANTRPRTAASMVRNTEISITFCCLATVWLASVAQQHRAYPRVCYPVSCRGHRATRRCARVRRRWPWSRRHRAEPACVCSPR